MSHPELSTETEPALVLVWNDPPTPDQEDMYCAVWEKVEGEGLGYVAERLGSYQEGVTVRIGCEHLFNSVPLNRVLLSWEVPPDAS